MDFSKIRNFLFLGLLGVVTILFLYIIWAFIYPIFWAAIIAGIFYPLYRRLNGFLKVPNLSATLMLILVLLVIVLPLFFVGNLVVKESVDIYGAVNNNRSQIITVVQDTLNWVKHNPYTAKFNINESFWTEKLTDLTKTVTNFLFTSAKDLTQNSLIFLLMFIITFYTLFFFIRDGEKILKKIMHLCPLGDKYEKMLYRRFTSTVRATLKGTIIVGGIQAAIAGVMFAIAGIQGVLIWTLVMWVCAIIPAISAAAIWFPAGLIMLIIGRTWQGIMILAVGVLVVSTIDNILRPILVGKDAQMHPLLVLLSTLGGIAVFGVSGFVIGPVITALLLSFWEMYEEYYKNELDHN